jgi:hypothetical protein
MCTENDAAHNDEEKGVNVFLECTQFAVERDKRQRFVHRVIG